jgi:hypothetical protein
MKRWQIQLKFSDDSEKEITLFDAKTYFDGYIKLKRSYFNSLVKALKITKRYITGKAIQKVVGPDGEDWTFNPWILILVKDNEKEKPFWFFIKRETDLSGLLVAIGPRPFVDYNTYNPEANREVKKIINYIVSYIKKFELVILLPNYLNAEILS